MLYHVPDMEKAFSEVYRVLVPGGLFYASTVGRNHMAEMREIAARFAQGTITTKSWDLTEQFQLENGMEHFLKWFDDVELKRYDDNLIVTGAAPLIDYIFSMPGNTRDVLPDEKLQEIQGLLEDEILKTGGIFITKDTGFFRGRKLMKQ
jgi:SAM-dependent methyltransferase